MPNLLIRAALLSILLIAPLLFGADADSGPKNLKARTALKKYDRAVEKADAAHRKAVADAGKVLLAELEAAKREAMKAANLPEATAIQRIADRTGQELESVRKAGPASENRDLRPRRRDAEGFPDRLLADLADGKKRQQPRPAADLKGLIGTWVLRYGNGNEREYEIAPDGRVTFKNGGATAPLRKADDGGGLLLDFGDGKIERLHLVDGLLVVEHFNPKSTLASGRFDQLGVARPSED